MYRCYDKDDALLYIGGTLYFQARVLRLRQSKEWFNNVFTVKIEHFTDSFKMRAAERLAIAIENPRYNVMSKDTKKAKRLVASIPVKNKKTAQGEK